MKGSELLSGPVDCSRSTLEIGRTEEAFETTPSDLRRRLTVNVPLVVLKELVLFFGKNVGFQGHLKAMCWFWRILHSMMFALVDSTEEVKFLPSASFVSSSVDSQ